MKAPQLIMLAIVIFCQETFSQNCSTSIFLDLANLDEKFLQIAIEDSSGEMRIDTILRQPDGNFEYCGGKIKKAQSTAIFGNHFNIQDILIAPGYQLEIKGDASDYNSLRKSLRFSGIGSKCNSYHALLDSLQSVSFCDDFSAMTENEAVTCLTRFRKVRDSLAAGVFFEGNSNDIYQTRFGEIALMDNEFLFAASLFRYAHISHYSMANMNRLLGQNTKLLQANYLDNDDFLGSTKFKQLMLGDFAHYLAMRDRKKGDTGAINNSEILVKLSVFLSGNVRNHLLFESLTTDIDQCNTYMDLLQLKSTYDSSLAKLIPENYDARIRTSFEDKEQYIQSMQVGRPAPFFSGIDQFGKRFTNKDFIGRVVYVDLWASWCLPCRKEMPFFKELVSKYKGNDGIIFVGISVADKMGLWRAALKEDQVTGLQLYDEDGSTGNGFQIISIPRFMILDKSGNIVNANAPSPSEGSKLMEILDRELLR